MLILPEGTKNSVKIKVSLFLRKRRCSKNGIFCQEIILIGGCHFSLYIHRGIHIQDLSYKITPSEKQGKK